MTPIPGSGARCCDAGSGVVSPASLSVSPYLCGQMLWRRLRGRVSRLSPCVSQSLRSDARCCDAGSGVVCLPLVSLSPSYQMLWRWLRGCVSRLSPCVSAVGCQLAAWSCLPLVSLCLCLPVSAVRCQTLAPGRCLPLVSLCLPVSAVRCQMLLLCVPPPACSLSPSLCSQMPDAVTLAAGSCRVSRLSPCVLQGLSGQIPDAVTLAAGSCLALVSLCLPVRGQMPDAVTLAPGRVPRLSPSFSQTLVPGLRSDARCWDAGSGVVSPACLPVSPSLCGWLFV